MIARAIVHFLHVHGLAYPLAGMVIGLLGMGCFLVARYAPRLSETQEEYDARQR